MSVPCSLHIALPDSGVIQFLMQRLLRKTLKYLVCSVTWISDIDTVFVRMLRRKPK